MNRRRRSPSPTDQDADRVLDIFVGANERAQNGSHLDGFRFLWSRMYGARPGGFGVGVPDWLVGARFAILPAVWLRRWWGARRRRSSERSWGCVSGAAPHS